MELTAFGAIIKFAMDREEDIAARAAALVGDEGPSPVELAGRVAAEARKSAKLLERTRREHVNELVLEPVTGLESRDYEFEEPPSDESTESQALEHLARILETMVRFYTDAAARITNPEAKRTFSRIAKTKARLRARIQ